jgi:hypothetical protein
MSAGTSVVVTGFGSDGVSQYIKYCFRTATDILSHIQQINHHISENFQYIIWHTWNRISDKVSKKSYGGAKMLNQSRL